MASDNLHKGANPKLFWYARQNRKVMTNAEKVLWDRLRNRRLKGYKFRRQHPIGNFIADFFCLECNLIVEVDGEYHNEESQSQYDEGRTFELNEFSVKVVRFTNKEVIDKIDFVLKEIESHLIPSPSP